MVFYMLEDEPSIIEEKQNPTESIHTVSTDSEKSSMLEDEPSIIEEKQNHTESIHTVNTDSEKSSMLEDEPSIIEENQNHTESIHTANTNSEKSSSSDTENFSTLVGNISKNLDHTLNDTDKVIESLDGPLAPVEDDSLHILNIYHSQIDGNTTSTEEKASIININEPSDKKSNEQTSLKKERSQNLEINKEDIQNLTKIVRTDNNCSQSNSPDRIYNPTLTDTNLHKPLNDGDKLVDSINGPLATVENDSSINSNIHKSSKKRNSISTESGTGETHDEQISSEKEYSQTIQKKVADSRSDHQSLGEVRFCYTSGILSYSPPVEKDLPDIIMSDDSDSHEPFPANDSLSEEKAMGSNCFDSVRNTSTPNAEIVYFCNGVSDPITSVQTTNYPVGYSPPIEKDLPDIMSNESKTHKPFPANDNFSEESQNSEKSMRSNNTDSVSKTSTPNSELVSFSNGVPDTITSVQTTNYSVTRKQEGTQNREMITSENIPYIKNAHQQLSDVEQSTKEDNSMVEKEKKFDSSVKKISNVSDTNTALTTTSVPTNMIHYIQSSIVEESSTIETCVSDPSKKNITNKNCNGIKKSQNKRLKTSTKLPSAGNVMVSEKRAIDDATLPKKLPQKKSVIVPKSNVSHLAISTRPKPRFEPISVYSKFEKGENLGPFSKNSVTSPTHSKTDRAPTATIPTNLSEKIPERQFHVKKSPAKTTMKKTYKDIIPRPNHYTTVSNQSTNKKSIDVSKDIQYPRLISQPKTSNCHTYPHEPFIPIKSPNRLQKKNGKYERKVEDHNINSINVNPMLKRPQTAIRTTAVTQKPAQVSKYSNKNCTSTYNLSEEIKQPKSSSVTSENDNEASPPFNCLSCPNMTFKIKEDLLFHMRNHKKNSTNTTTAKQSNFNNDSDKSHAKESHEVQEQSEAANMVLQLNSQTGNEMLFLTGSQEIETSNISDESSLRINSTNKLQELQGNEGDNSNIPCSENMNDDVTLSTSVPCSNMNVGKFKCTPKALVIGVQRRIFTNIKEKISSEIITVREKKILLEISKSNSNKIRVVENIELRKYVKSTATTSNTHPCNETQEAFCRTCIPTVLDESSEIISPTCHTNHNHSIGDFAIENIAEPVTVLERSEANTTNEVMAGNTDTATYILSNNQLHIPNTKGTEFSSLEEGNCDQVCINQKKNVSENDSLNSPLCPEESLGFNPLNASTPIMPHDFRKNNNSKYSKKTSSDENCRCKTCHVNNLESSILEVHKLFHSISPSLFTASPELAYIIQAPESLTTHHNSEFCKNNDLCDSSDESTRSFPSCSFQKELNPRHQFSGSSISNSNDLISQNMAELTTLSQKSEHCADNPIVTVNTTIRKTKKYSRTPMNGKYQDEQGVSKDDEVASKKQKIDSSSVLSNPRFPSGENSNFNPLNTVGPNDNSYMNPNTSSNSNSNRCEGCDKNISDENLLAVHHMFHTFEKARKEKRPDSPLVAKPNNHLSIEKTLPTQTHCSECNQSFQTVTQYNIHVLSHPENVYNCVVCHSEFKSRPQSHWGIDPAKNITCPNCHHQKTIETYYRNNIEHVFETRDNRASVSDITSRGCDHEEAGDKTEVCHVCDQKLDKYLTLEKHVLQHGIGKKLSCRYCKKEFTRMDCLLNHINEHNTKLYKCIDCSMVLRPKDFKSHRRLHSFYSQGGEHFR